jgi:hypothetical protein
MPSASEDFDFGSGEPAAPAEERPIGESPIDGSLFSGLIGVERRTQSTMVLPSALPGPAFCPTAESSSRIDVSSRAGVRVFESDEIMQSIYQALLLDERWLDKRAAIIHRDHAQCQQCGGVRAALEVHHIIYLRGHMPWDYPDHLLVTLCSICHDREEEQRAEADAKLTSAFWLLGATNERMRVVAELLTELDRLNDYNGRLLYQLRESLEKAIDQRRTPN